VLLEMSEGVIPNEVKQGLAFSNKVKHINDLIYMFKRMLTTQYNLSGYIIITEDQGDWDSSHSFLPI
jgi:hypothetical protein